MVKYHLRRKDKEITDKESQIAILKNGKYATIGLCRDGEPYVVTLNYGLDANKTVLYFHCAKEGLKLDFLHANPRVCVTVIEDLGYRSGECNHAYRSVVLWGRMRTVEDLIEKKHGVEILFQHLEEDPDPIRARNLKSDQDYLRVGILRLDIEDITGKEGS
jgi:nitroimidazol reductase NimA-like FMN-containing flavoprotein (pyridoxamine 5'-phosphate oxidase superfamily)